MGQAIMTFRAVPGGLLTKVEADELGKHNHSHVDSPSELQIP